MVLILRIATIVISLCCVGVVADEAAEDFSVQLDRLSQKVDELEQQLQRQESWMFSARSIWQERVRFNGFASFGLSKVNGSVEDERYHHGQSKDLSVLPNTWLGLRLDTLLYSSGELIAQFVVNTDRDDNLDIRTEWLFLKQDLGAGLSAHIGRIRFPAHIDSEVIYVGNVYPTVMPSAEIYSVLSMNHLDGVALSHSLPLGSSAWAMDSKVILWGQGKDLRSGLSFRLKEVQGLALSFSNDIFTTRLAVFSAKKILDINYPKTDGMPQGMNLRISDRLDYLTAALRFDDQRLYASLEGIAISSHNNRVDEIRNWNAVTGVYLGSSLLYVGYARQHTVNTRKLAKELNNHGVTANAAAAYCPDTAVIENGMCTMPAGGEFAKRYNRQQKNLQLGVKHNITPRVVLKGQTQILHDFKGTRGVFEYYDGTFMDKRKRIYIYDIAVQAFF